MHGRPPSSFWIKRIRQSIDRRRALLRRLPMKKIDIAKDVGFHRRFTILSCMAPFLWQQPAH